MDFAALTRHWDRFGATDPLWAILTDPAHKGNRWDPEAFFATGREEIAQVVARAQQFGVPRRWDRGLDFGCGVGRLTQALAGHVGQMTGLDVAPSMIEQARAFNRHGSRCDYQVNASPDLRRWPDGSFDVIYTGRVLQHMEPVYSTSYVREFTRLLAPRGYLSFDLPSEHGFFPADSTQDLGTDRYRAGITILDRGPLAARPDQPLAITVAVTNHSAHTWTADPAHTLNAGNHWHRPDTAQTQRDDVRVAMPLPWRPGETVQLVLTTRTPREAGVYHLQCDLVEEGRTWFADVTGAMAQIEVLVGAASASPMASEPLPSAATAADEPQMEMHAVPRTEVEQILRDAGITLLDVTRVDHCGPTWLAYRYEGTR